MRNAIGEPSVNRSRWIIVREHPLLATFFFTYYVILISYGVAIGSAQTIFYVVFVGVGALIVAALHRRTQFSQLVLWGLAVWGVAHMVGGLVEVGGRVIYELSIAYGEFRFDKVVHFFGFGFATLAAFELLRQRVAADAPVRPVVIIAAFVGLGIGAVNETIEFAITLLPGESNVGGFSNTGWDLVANAAGAVVAASCTPTLERRRKSA